ncbi:unnamed protein product [Rotaria sordida]|nr:unnamed protein product [Rotaria sordida]CAF4065467.1 unnamed protein product [Rotaria sordida]
MISPNAPNGTYVAGSSNGTSGNGASLLNAPEGIWFDDKTKAVYIADTRNGRIQRWQANANKGDTIAGLGIHINCIVFSLIKRRDEIHMLETDFILQVNII